MVRECTTGFDAGAATLAILPATFGIAGYVLPIAMMTASYALFQAANNTVVMTNAGPEQRGVISGMLSLSRNLGLITRASMMGAVFAAGAGSANMIAAHLAAVAHAMRLTFTVGAGLIVVSLLIKSAARIGIGRLVRASVTAND